MELKKNPKVALSRWSNVFFLTGLAIMLGISYMALELKSYDSVSSNGEQLVVSNDLLNDIPITQLSTPPPPPPPPPSTTQLVIEVIEDNIDIEETIIQSTETDQDNVISEVVEIADVEEADVDEEEIVNVPFAVIEDVPIYPGCENMNNNATRKSCMADKVVKFVQERFNTELAGELGLEGRQRISVQFRIDKNGDVVDVRARAPHPKLEEEAVRVVRSLPKMIPGKQRGKPVGVLYALPILFKVEPMDN